MAAAAAAGAERVIITDDNPRTEDPAAIREEIAEGAPDALKISGRKEAIFEGIKGLEPGDVLLVAGKGHEQGQTVGSVTYPFDDVAITETLMREVNT